ncbi:hypothetical protein [Crateriforma conspicua]|uniref:Uncharacterized protein n=1 Tax=Crateriforma conspicua TaxID=2527996 RepID=A0A5C5Y2A8_9PLAN|nr:hypothetical protein [Crateriforma conspicua]TWT69344.1 hypothetical protein Pan14r_16300 [Crateriforma conspicua]
MAKYKPEAEGALYSKRRDVPLDEAGAGQIVDAFNATMDGQYFESVKQNALKVLVEQFDERIELCTESGLAVINGERVGWSRESSELVRDAFDLLQRVWSIQHEKERLLSLKPISEKSLTRLLTLCAELGQRNERLLLCNGGIESMVDSQSRSEAGLPEREQEFSDDDIKSAWDKACSRYQTGRVKTKRLECAARIVGCSKKTIERRLKKILK